jgi:hypothetical protein
MRWIVLAAWLLSLAILLLPNTTAQEPETPEAALKRPLLTKDDFEYVGAFALPKIAVNWSTAFGDVGIAMRRFNGKLRFITATHRYSKDALYEVEFPGFGLEENKWPEAKLVKEWGTDLYGDSKLVKAKTGEIGLVDGLHYDERTNRLYYNFGSWYNIPPTNDPAMGFAVLEDDKVAKVGTGWKSPDGHAAHSQKIRGGTLIIPDWFSTTYLGGRRLGLGFGGYYSGVSNCSKGPFLAAAHEPSDTAGGGTLDMLTLIDHPDKHWGLRDPDYKSEINWAPNPRGDVGYWGAMDEVNGAGIWIDLPDKHGLLIGSNMGHGRVWYEMSDRHCERLEAWWWVYDPAQLAEVATRKRNPWDCEPKFWKMDYKPRPLRIKTSGFCFDSATRTLFVSCQMSVKSGVEYHTLIHGYRIKK